MASKFIVYEDWDKAVTGCFIITERMRMAGVINDGEFWCTPRAVGFENDGGCSMCYYSTAPDNPIFYKGIKYVMVTEDYLGDRAYYMVKNANDSEENAYSYKKSGTKDLDNYDLFATNGLKTWNCEYQEELTAEEFVAVKDSPIFNDYSLVSIGDKYESMERLLIFDRAECIKMLQAMLAYYSDKSTSVINNAQAQLSNFDTALRSYNVIDVDYEAHQLTATIEVPQDFIDYFKNEIEKYLRKFPR